MSRIWVPRTKILEPNKEILIACKLAGRFKLEAVRPDGRRRMLADWFPNLITNAGLNRIGTASDWLAACRVGTGSTTPTTGDTGMASFVAGTTGIQSTNAAAQGSAPYYGTITMTYRFNTGVAAGNLAEVGIATQAAAGGTQFSRALILDGSGDPTTITVLSDEVLDVTYQLQNIVPAADVNDTVVIGGVTYDLVARAMGATSSSVWAGTSGATAGPGGATSYSGTIGAVTAAPAGTTGPVGSSTPASYGSNNFYRETTQTWGLNNGNFSPNGMRAIAFSHSGGGANLGSSQISINNPLISGTGIPKTNAQTLSLVTRYTWARGTPI